MNASILTSDRVTHLKIGITAVLATALVIMIGVYARPPGSPGGQPAPIATEPAVVVMLEQQVLTTR